MQTVVDIPEICVMMALRTTEREIGGSEIMLHRTI
jgi:hypothetical protein